MQAITSSEAKKTFFEILKSKRPTLVKYRDIEAVILPKEEFDRMERDLIKAEIERTLRSGQRVLSGEEVAKKVAEVLNA